MDVCLNFGCDHNDYIRIHLNTFSVCYIRIRVCVVKELLL